MSDGTRHSRAEEPDQITDPLLIAEAEAEGAKARVLDWKRQLAEQNDPAKK